MSRKINMHDKVYDKVTGLEGVVVGRTEWDNGCVRYAVQPRVIKDGKPVEATWIDEQNVAFADDATGVAKTGGTGGPPVHGDPRK